MIQELDSKQRRIRSFRGFFLYALEIMEKEKDYEILQTNLQPFFWKKVHNIIRQNKQGALRQFLFPNATDNEPNSQGSSPALQELQNQVDSLAKQAQGLQQKVIQLESKLENPKYTLSEPLQPLESLKTTQQEDYTLNSNTSPVRKKSFQENDNNFHQAQEASLKSLSEDSRIHFKNDQTTQEYNIPSN